MYAQDFIAAIGFSMTASYYWTGGSDMGLEGRYVIKRSRVR